jgi:hypothetical protein
MLQPLAADVGSGGHLGTLFVAGVALNGGENGRK